MRVLFLNPSAQLGGAERCLIDIFEGLRARSPSWELHLLTSGQGPLVSLARSTGAQITVLPFPSSVSRLGDGGRPGRKRGFEWYGRGVVGWGRAIPQLIRYLFRLRSAIREIAPDVIHSNGFKMHLLGVWAAGRVPVVWHVHDFVSQRPVMARVLRSQARRCSAVIANSRAVQEDVQDVCGAAIRVHVAYNGIDLDRFSPTGPVLDLDEHAGVGRTDSEAVRIGLVATFAWWKGHRVFLEALARLPDDLSFRAYIVGGPVYETEGSQYSVEEMIAISRELGLEQKVAFTGFVDDSSAAMRWLDVVVHASTRPEPFGLVIAEAMACGRPVIVSTAGGAAELITPGVDGLGHLPGEVAGLAGALERLIRSASLRESVGKSGRESAVRRFDRNRLAGEVESVYRSVLQASA